MTKHRPISQKISRVYYIGGIALLILYSLVFNTAVVLTENLQSERRLEVVAPYHFQHYEQGKTGAIKISSIEMIYDDISLLPIPLQRRINEGLEGAESFHLEEDILDVSEYVVFATQVMTPTGEKTVYAVETPDAVEWDDLKFFVVEVAVFVLGFAVLLVIAGFIVRAASKISEPFIQLANRLESITESDFEHIEMENITSIELAQTLASLNNYRSRIRELLAREKSFTRYVSHELRTPMTVVKGALSILRKQDNEQALKQANRIHDAIEQMEQLTQTFLLLARNEDAKPQCGTVQVSVDQEFVEKLRSDINAKAEMNQTKVSFDLGEEFILPAESLLLYSAIHNILLNAVNSTLQGQVRVNISEQGVEVVDSGVGLKEKARGYEGFGIGLLLVKDICDKYSWQFELADNEDTNGCRAVIRFT